MDSSGGGISALWLVVRSVDSCAVLAKSVFVHETNVLRPAAASGGFVRPKILSRSDVGQKIKMLKDLRMGLPIVEILADFRRVFLAYLEGLNSILVKKKYNNNTSQNGILYSGKA